LETETLGYEIKLRLDQILDKLQKNPENLETLQSLLATAELSKILPFDVNLWKPQTYYHVLRTTIARDMQLKETSGDPGAKAWMETFLRLGEHLGFNV
jgi:hypothetical protein